MAEQPIKIGALVNEKGGLIILNDKQVNSKDFTAEFVVFTNGSYDNEITKVVFLETEKGSGIYDSFGLVANNIDIVLAKYDGIKGNQSIFFVTKGVVGYSDSETKISKAAFEAKNLKITLKALTQEDKVTLIKANFGKIRDKYLSKFINKVAK